MSSLSARFNNALEFWARYERFLSVATTIFGFSFDLVIAKRPDSVYDNALLLSYLIASATCIVLLNIRARSAAQATQPLLLLLIVQFCFGGLSSNLLILYGKSGTPSGDILFLFLLLALLVGNEFLRTRYDQARFNIGIYYLLLLTYCVIAVPTFILHDVGPRAFLESAAASLAAMAFFLFVLYTSTRLFRGPVGPRLLTEAIAIVIGIAVFFSGLYFLNIIPPVPLSLKDSGVYHFIAKANPDTYYAQYEAAPWWAFWQSTSNSYSIGPNQAAYCFSSVFAPSGLSTPIRHEWQYYDETAKEWITEEEVSFPISGGRAGGYRGFSQKFSLTPGEWRCNVETSSGQLIGRVSFTAVSTSTEPAILTTTL